MCRTQNEGSHWPQECGLRADYLFSLILNAIGKEDEARALRAASLAELQSLIFEHSPGTLGGGSVYSLREMDQLALFDRIVPIYAGRFVVCAASS